MAKSRKFNREHKLQYGAEWRAKQRADPERLAKHREYQRNYQREWNKRPENRKKLREASLAHYYKNREREINRAHWHNVLKRYGLTKDHYEQIIQTQGGGCALCGISKQPSGKRLSIDHCHKSTVVRGILCEPCNVLLGSVESRPADWMQKAQQYLADNPAAKVVHAKCTKVERSNLVGSNWPGSERNPK